MNLIPLTIEQLKKIIKDKEANCSSKEYLDCNILLKGKLSKVVNRKQIRKEKLTFIDGNASMVLQKGK
jgi:hypothetical protein